MYMPYPGFCQLPTTCAAHVQPQPSLIYASALAARGAYSVTYASGLRCFKHLCLCSGWHVCFAGDVERMTTHTSLLSLG